ncbi:MAG: hypothetical protein ACE5JG_06535, partial [Planctomycetota bacterium]
ILSEAAAGTRMLITRHRQPIAQLTSVDLRHLHLGERFGKGKIEALLRGRTRGRYLAVLADDRRGGDGGR